MTIPEAPIPSANKPDITCREVLDSLMAYLDGELTPEQRQEFERHMGACPSCVDYLNSYKTTISIGKVAMRNPDEPVMGWVPEDLIRAVRQARLKGA